MTNQPDAPKAVRRPRRMSVAKRNVLLVLSVFVFAFGLVGSPVGDPPLFGEAEPAAASHCGPGDYQWLCIMQENCANSGGTLVGLTCVVPTTTTTPPTTTTTTTTTQPPPTPQQQCANSGGTWTIYGCWHQPSCPAGQHWVPAGSVNGSCQARLCTPGDGQHRHIYTTYANACHDDHTTANTCGPGQHLNGHDTCHADHDCAEGDHVHGHETCHTDHTCPSGQVLYGHDQCRAAPVQCTPGVGEHRHTLFNNQVQCHADHTCDSGEHLDGHEACHADHTCDSGEHLDGHEACHADHACPSGQVLYNHDRCRGAAPQCTPSTGEHKHTVTNLNQVYCHADHTCVAGETLYDHDRCRAAASQQCTLSTGEHTHTVTNLNQVYCHADHTCPPGQELYDHDRCRDASSSLTHQQRCVNSGGTWTIYGCWYQPSCPSNQQWVPAGSVNGACTPCPSGEHSHTTCHTDHTTANTCDAGEHLDGHDTCHEDHTCPSGQVLFNHDQCRAGPVQCTPGDGQHSHTLFNNHVQCHDDHTPANTCNTGQVLQGHDECVDPTPTTPPTTPPPVSGSLVAPTNVAASCAAGRLVVVWTVVQSGSVQRGFEIEANEETVTVPYVVGFSNLEWIWGEAESGKSYQIRIRERAFSSAGDGTVDIDLSPWVQTAVTCERLVPQDFEVSCNAHGVVEAQWDQVNGVGSYQVEWLPQHEVGSNEVRTVTTTNPTWQADEGGRYILRVRAYSTAAAGWSAYSERQTATCQEVSFPVHSWASNSPNFGDDDPDTEITDYVLISRLCPTTQVGDRSTRTCTEVWEEHITIRVDQREWWKRLPLAQWSNGYDVMFNILDLGAMIAALRGSQSSRPNVRVGSEFVVLTEGARQSIGYSEITENERVYFKVYPLPPQPNPPISGRPLVTGCLLPRYEHQSVTLDRMTYTTGNHTTYRDVTVHYCDNRFIQ